MKIEIECNAIPVSKGGVIWVTNVQTIVPTSTTAHGIEMRWQVDGENTDEAILTRRGSIETAVKRMLDGIERIDKVREQDRWWAKPMEVTQ